jgi:rhodanese-related sulfurtransferase
MPATIGRNEVQRLVLEEQAAIVEVLPHEEFEAEHITGAISLPIKELNAETAARLDPDRPVIVYCWDLQ